MLFIKKYQALIQNLPIWEQAFTVKRKNKKWQDAEVEFAFVKAFNMRKLDSGLLTLNRKSLLHGTIDREFVLKVLYWGYPKGMRGPESHMAILKKATEIANTLRSLREKKNNDHVTFSRLFEKLLSYDGMGISTASKLLYFANIKVEGLSALILDERLKRCFKNKVFSELEPLAAVPYKMNAEYYIRYLEQLQQLAQAMQTEPDRIELFLFLFGNNLQETN